MVNTMYYYLVPGPGSGVWTDICEGGVYRKYLMEVHGNDESEAGKTGAASFSGYTLVSVARCFLINKDIHEPDRNTASSLFIF